MVRRNVAVLCPSGREFGEGEFAEGGFADGDYGDGGWQSEAPPHRGRTPLVGRAAAPFLVHLIATRLGIAETRARRRAEPETAAKRYGAASGLAVPGGAKGRFSRSA